MTKPPIHRLSKAEIVKLATHTCKHGHTYLEHYGCYHPEEEQRIGFLDIETSGLNGDFCMMLSWCIKPNDSDEILSDVLTEEDIINAKAGKEDKRIVKSLVKAMEQFDLVVTWYGARFDLPMIRTRAAVCKIDFPEYGALAHRDLWFVCRGKYKLSSNRLENACRVLLGKSRKTRISSKYWNGAVRGDKDCLDFILKHNQFDVLDLEAIYNKIIGSARPVRNSI